MTDTLFPKAFKKPAVSKEIYPPPKIKVLPGFFFKEKTSSDVREYFFKFSH